MMKSEMAEIRKLVDVFRPKRRCDSEDSEKRGRYTRGEEDVPSDTSEAESQDGADQNAATEPYWEGTSSMKVQEKTHAM